ncbi:MULTISPECIES: serine hydrolase domain-containing protein [Novosphingobium]|uniref:serine hydrolase domain-containing protein n=1 Tax=Novosphingobium sp. ST904 TaxID=1684385 RepID=UPI0006C87A2C|nr:serine hydrolase [Novosphingobium sp. ST904]KPH57486.1 beta-lactamase [Novosphingobium sp. ST904]TCM43035.1 CubicO group peptidase (beta-lactamase class C family) [Novosphingobium sp. ST904]
MPVRRPSLILALSVLPALGLLSGCGQDAQQGPPPPSAESQAAIKDDGGAPRESLGRAIDGLFGDEDVGRTDALVVMKRGSVIAERYGAGIKPETRLHGWGMGQCVTALMIGQLVSDGRLRLNESAPIPAWQRPGDPRGEITLKQLLQMRSGLRHSESGPPAANGNPEAGLARQSDRMRMLYLDGRDDMAAYAEAQPLEAPAGARFVNSAATPVILSDLAARVLSPDRNPDRRRRAVGDYLRNRVLLPLGMDSGMAGFDRAGTMIGSAMIHADARDWAKLGEFLRHTGSIQGAQILPRRWVQFMLEPSPRNPGYGAGVWLNRGRGKNGGGDEAVLFPGMAPANVFACVGEHGQYVIGSPDQLLTIVRLGESDPQQERLLHDRLGKLMAMFPGGI